MPDGSLLEVKDLHAAYGPTQVLHGISFGLQTGHITTILGANGAGKTTTLRAICQMVRTSGSALFEGHQLVGRATEEVVRLGVAHVPDGRGTFTALSVEENLAPGRLRAARQGARRRGHREDVFAFSPGSASGGASRRAPCRAASSRCSRSAAPLMLRPKLLLLDEPSFGLAPKIVAEIFRILRTINVDDGVSLLLVEQNAQLALELADRAYLLETGRVALSGSSQQLMADESVRRTYLGI